MTHNSHPGFTLVEIMIVVAIIALLAAIAVPNFLRARVRSQATTLVNDVRMIDYAAEQYAIEKGLSTSTSIHFDSLVNQGYFKSGSKIYVGNSAVDLLAINSTLGVIYTNIIPAQKLTVVTALRDLFTPTVLTTDVMWQ
ncbi:MAG: prepilin-type N-terminal cleavage/methylation domain-containing protein [Verrucomicrobiae bacterium]|nr:prepilin-type N-terminal cleavage/methylation domain-containing protein [Verrucomicrobiae bacterium]